jgi:PAS domain S-box-containing protein
MTRVLYIDDESTLLTLTQIYLKEEAHLDVDIASSAEEGLMLLKKAPYDAIISDYDMPDIDGIEFLKMVRAYDIAIPFIFFTGKGREEVAIEALNNGADFYIQKGGDPHIIFTELANAVRHLVRRSHAERNAILSEEQLKAYLNGLPDLAFIKGPDYRHLLINTSYLTFLGLSSVDDAIGKTDEEILPPTLAEICRKSDEQVINRNLPVSTLEISGGRIYQVIKFPLPVPTGQTGIGGIVRDITDQYQMKTALHESEERFKSLAESHTDLVIRLDRNHRHLYVNSIVEEHFNVPAISFVGKTYADLGFPPDQVAFMDQVIDEVFTTGTRQHFEFKLLSGIWIDCTMTPERSEDGEIRYVIITGRDITPLRDRESALREANHKIQVFSGIAGQDILNQVHVISHATQALHDTIADSAKGSQDLEKISRASHIIKDLIRFSLDYLEVGLHVPAWQDLVSMIKDSAADTVPGCITLTIQTQEYSIFADPLLKKALFHIFEDAVKHGGDIHHIDIFSSDQPDGSVRIVIKDDGIGISPEIKHHIFEETTGSNSRYGLFLVREILAVTGLSIRETGTPGSGAQFEITVPAGRWKIAEMPHF